MHENGFSNIYLRLRQSALENRPQVTGNDLVHIVLMDWKLERGNATVLACADGSASLYLSSGGGYIGGGQKDPAIRDSALLAVYLAGKLLREFRKTETFDLPVAQDVFFYATTIDGVYHARAPIVSLRNGTHLFSTTVVVREFRREQGVSTP